MSEQTTPTTTGAVLRDSKYTLTAEPVNGSRRPPNLKFLVNRNQPVIEVRTNVDNDKNYGRISANMEPAAFFAAMHVLGEIAEGPNDNHMTFENLVTRWVDRKPTDPKLDTKLTIGKDAEGIVFIAVLSWEQGRPMIKFPFGFSDKTRVVSKSGEALSRAELSRIAALGFQKMWLQMAPQVLIEDYTPPPPRDGQGGNNGGQRQGGFQGGGNNYQNRGNGGGYQNNNNSGGYSNQSTQQSSSSGSSGGGGGSWADDDLPF